MRVKGWLVIALAITVAGSGTGILAQAMTDRYDREVTKIVVSTAAKSPTGSAVETYISDEVVLTGDEEDSAVETETKDVGDDDMQGDDSGSAESSAVSMDFSIRKKSDKFSLKKTKADMPMQDAVAIAVTKAGYIFGGFKVEEVTGVDLCEPEVLHELKQGEKEEYYRAYCGDIICKEGYAVYFEVDSINGQIQRLEKVVNQYDKEYDDELLEEIISRKIQKERDLYGGLASPIIDKYLEKRGAKCIDVSCGGISMKAGGYKSKRIAALAECETIDGTIYMVMFDPNNIDVIGIRTMWSDGFKKLDNEEPQC